MWRVRLFEESNLVLSQVQGKRRYSICRMIRFGRSTMGAVTPRLAQKPGQCNRGHEEHHAVPQLQDSAIALK